MMNQKKLDSVVLSKLNRTRLWTSVGLIMVLVSILLFTSMGAPTHSMALSLIVMAEFLTLMLSYTLIRNALVKKQFHSTSKTPNLRKKKKKRK